MSTSADLREHRIDFACGELEGELRASVASHVDDCDACAADVAGFGSVFDLVGNVTEIEPTAAETQALMAAVDAEIVAGMSEVGMSDAGTSGHGSGQSSEQEVAPVLRHPGLGGAWERAVWHYENSTYFRRLTIASIGLHAAAAAGVAWLLVGGSHLRQNPQFSVETAEQIRQLDDEVKQAFEDVEAESSRVHPDEIVARAPSVFIEATPDGVLLPSSISEPGALRGRGEKLRAPTVGILIQLRSVLDDADRSRRLGERIGGVGPRANAAVESALVWLSQSRSADGRWGPVPTGGAEDVRDGVTAAAVLAFVQNGHSATEGEYAKVLAPAVEALEKRLRDGAAEHDTKPVYSHALALRALAWSWALDFRHMDAAQRESRQALLAEAGRSLLESQHENGGFGYRTDGDRTDASCTLFVVGALADLRLAGVLRADDALRRAGVYLASISPTSSDGDEGNGAQPYQKAGDRKGDLALTAGLLANARELGVKGDLSERLDQIREALATGKSSDALLAWSGMQALRRHGGLAPAMTTLLDRQRENGSWPAATDRHCRLGGDDLTTAMGVLAVTRIYMP